jgi:hypothetical protein
VSAGSVAALQVGLRITPGSLTVSPARSTRSEAQAITPGHGSAPPPAEPLNWMNWPSESETRARATDDFFTTTDGPPTPGA